MKRHSRLNSKITPMRALVTAWLACYALFFMLLCAWTIMNSFKGHIEYNKDRLSLPEKWLFSNYKLAIETMKAGGNSVVQMIFNALWLTAGLLFFGQACPMMFAYAMCRFNFPLKKVFENLNLVIIMIPIMGSMPSYMKMLMRLGLYDNPLFILTAVGGFGGGLILYRNIFRSVPWEFAEAAYIDGANHWQVFLKLMIPQIKSFLIAQTIGLFRSVWNDPLTPLIYLPSYPTLSSGLYVYQIEMARKVNTPVLFAGCFMCALPPVLLFIFFNKHMMSIDLSGGIKG